MTLHVIGPTWDVWGGAEQWSASALIHPELLRMRRQQSMHAQTNKTTDRRRSVKTRHEARKLVVAS